MYIPESQSNHNDQDVNAIDVMDKSMNYLWENFIEPNVDVTDEDQATMLTIIGATFKIMAEQAHAYEKLNHLDFRQFLQMENLFWHLPCAVCWL